MGAKNDLGHRIKHKLTGYKASPDDKVWSAIEDQLKKDRKKAIYVRLLYGIPFLLLLLIGGYYFVSEYNSNDVFITTEEYDDNCEEDDLNEGNTVEHDQGTSKSQFIVDTNSIEKSNEFEKDDTESYTDSNKVSSNADQYSTTRSSEKRTVFSSFQTKEGIENPKEQARLKRGDTNLIVNISAESDLNTSIDTTSIAQEELPEVKLKEEKKLAENDTLENQTEPAPKIALSGHVSYDYFGSFNHSTSDNSNINFGLRLHYRILGDHAIRIGLNYMDLEFQYEELNQIYSERLEYFELPIDFNTRIIDRKVDLSLSFGLSYWFLLNNETKINGMAADLRNSQKNTYSLNFGIPVETELTSRMLFFIEPSFRYWPITFENRVETQPYMISITTGIIYKF